MALILPPYTSPGNPPYQLPETLVPGTDTNTTSTHGFDQIPELPPTSSNKVFKNFCTTCLNGLNMIQLINGNIGNMARSQTCRLRLWGTGLSDELLPLEALLSAYGNPGDSLYTFLLESFVEIVIAEGLF